MVFAYEPEELLQMGIGSWLVCVHLWLSLRSASFAQLQQVTEAAVKWLCDHAKRIWAGENTTQQDLVSRRVSELMAIERERRTNTCCATIAFICSVSVALFVMKIATHAPRWMTPPQVLTLCGVLAATMLQHHCHIFQRWAVFGVYSFINTSAIVFVQLSQSERSVVLYAATACVFLRVAASMSCLDLRMVIPWNVLCSVSAALKYAISDDGVDFALGYESFIWIEVFSCIVIVSLAEGLERATRAEKHSEVTARASAIERSALKLLLEHVCDVVLQTDAKFVINREARRFSAMLMLRSNQSLAGKNLEDFMPYDQDKVRFRDLFAAKGTGPDPPVRCLNVHLRDGNGSPIGVEVFGLPFEQLDDTKSYMVGIREYSDTQPTPLQGREPGEATVETTRVRQVPQHGTPPILIGNSLHADESSRASQSSSSITSRGQHLALPHMKETTLDTKQTAMAAMLATWNMKTYKKRCCSLHACLPDVRMLLDVMSTGPCDKNLHAGVRSQCAKCGLLNTIHEQTCCFCGHSALSSGVLNL
eukprot:TRINITY_DN21278_c0_g3_i1.p1 TRINITY_DN21278_c0_g3~~TRINITY_DN21278_c0_g3_i1.p1  ORF type:complete len:534 (-),score=87.70 TRINITY_DN21278_c0_g3_i1:83-1684(-)